MVAVFLCSCSCAKNKVPEGNVGSDALESTDASINAQQEGFSVHYLDIGQGDCIFIKFPDDKNLLIDSGAYSKSNSEYIVE